MKIVTILAAALAMLPLACTTGTQRAEPGPTPQQVVASGEARAEVHWGGQIVKVKNLRDRTLVEVLALPLDSVGRPQSDERPQGRFIIDRPGFLEPHEYAVDRLLEVRGRLNGFTSGTVGDAAYRYPVVIGEQLMLWPQDASSGARSTAPRINFGVGVSNHGGGVGVGIGF
jgi:outer membrane lipoprotein